MTDLVQKLRDRKQAIAWRRGQDTDYPTKWEPDALCQQAADEIETLRTQLAHWKVFAEHAEGEHAAWKKTGTELYDEVRRLHIAIARAVPAMHSYASKNPKHYMNDALQDPCGVHAWLAEFGA